MQTSGSYTSGLQQIIPGLQFSGGTDYLPDTALSVCKITSAEIRDVHARKNQQRVWLPRICFVGGSPRIMKKTHSKFMNECILLLFVSLNKF